MPGEPSTYAGVKNKQILANYSHYTPFPAPLGRAHPSSPPKSIPAASPRARLLGSLQYCTFIWTSSSSTSCLSCSFSSLVRLSCLVWTRYFFRTMAWVRTLQRDREDGQPSSYHETMQSKVMIGMNCIVTTDMPYHNPQSLFRLLKPLLGGSGSSFFNFIFTLLFCKPSRNMC